MYVIPYHGGVPWGLGGGSGDELSLHPIMCVNLQKYSNQFLTTARFVFRLPSAVVRTDKGTKRHEGADESSRPAQHGSARFCDMGRTLYDVLVLPTEAGPQPSPAQVSGPW